MWTAHGRPHAEAVIWLRLVDCALSQPHSPTEAHAPFVRVRAGTSRRTEPAYSPGYAFRGRVRAEVELPEGLPDGYSGRHLVEHIGFDPFSAPWRMRRDSNPHNRLVKGQLVAFDLHTSIGYSVVKGNW